MLKLFVNSLINRRFRLKNIKLPLLALAIVGIALILPSVTTRAIDGQEVQNTEMSEQQKKELEAIKKRAEQKKEDAQRQAEQKREDLKQQAEIKRETAKNRAEELLSQKKNSIKERTEAEKQKSCEQISSNLSKKLANGISRAEKHKTLFDNHLTKIEEFNASKQLTVSNYEALLATAQTAQTQAQTSIDGLKSFTPKVDCTNLGATTNNVAGYQVAIGDVKSDLNAYRTAIKDLLTAVKQAYEASEPESGASN